MRTRHSDEKHGFATIANYAGYAASVPISGYDAFAPYIEAVVAASNGN